MAQFLLQSHIGILLFETKFVRIQIKQKRTSGDSTVFTRLNMEGDTDISPTSSAGATGMASGGACAISGVARQLKLRHRIKSSQKCSFYYLITNG